MKFFSEVDFFVNLSYMVGCIKEGTAVVIVNDINEIDIAFGDSTDMYYIQREYKTIKCAKEAWDSFIYHYDVLINYIHSTSCTSCKYEKTTLTKIKIRKLFNLGVIYEGY